MREAFEAVRTGMQAIGRLDFEAAFREATRGSEVGAMAQEDLAACIGSAGF